MSLLISRTQKREAFPAEISKDTIHLYLARDKKVIPM